MTQSSWRLAGAGLLAAGLMTNAGAIAFADSGSGDSSGPGGTSTSDSSTSKTFTSNTGSTRQSGPLGSIDSAIRDTVQGATTALAAGQLPRLPAIVGSTGANGRFTVAKVPQMIAAGIRAQTTITGLSTQRPDPAVTPTDDSDPTVPVVADTSSPATGTAGSASSNKRVPDVTAPVATALSSTAEQLGRVTAAVVTPATAAVTAGVQGLTAPVYGVQSLVAPVATGIVTTLTAPIPDVVTALQSVLTSTTNAIVPITQIPSDLAALFGAAGVTTPSEVAGASAGLQPSTATPASEPLTVRALAGSTKPAVVVHDVAAQVAPKATTPTFSSTGAISRASAQNSTARATPANATSKEIQEFLNSYGALIITASLSAVFAAALPGIAAFLIPTVAGVGVGYRQARAALRVRASGVGRFAGSGPMGIVRSGSLISVRPGALRNGRLARSDAERHSNFAA